MQTDTNNLLFVSSSSSGTTDNKNLKIDQKNVQEDSETTFSYEIFLDLLTKQRAELDQLRGEIQTQDLEIKDLVNSFKKEIASNTKIFEEKINTERTKTTEILAIFISLFTFISVSFSALQNISVESAISLISLIGGFLLLFNLILTSTIDKKFPKFLLYIISLLLIFASIFLLINKNEFPLKILLFVNQKNP